MKRILFLLAFIIAAQVGAAQSVVQLRGDTIKIYKNGGTAELVLKNATASRTGAFLKNVANGTTEFGYAVDTLYMVDDSSLVFCRGSTCDTIIVSGSVTTIYTGDGSIPSNRTVTMGAGAFVQFYEDANNYFKFDASNDRLTHLSTASPFYSLLQNDAGGGLYVLSDRTDVTGNGGMLLVFNDGTNLELSINNNISGLQNAYDYTAARPYSLLATESNPIGLSLDSAMVRIGKGIGSSYKDIRGIRVTADWQVYLDSLNLAPGVYAVRIDANGLLSLADTTVSAAAQRFGVSGEDDTPTQHRKVNFNNSYSFELDSASFISLMVHDADFVGRDVYNIIFQDVDVGTSISSGYTVIADSRIRQSTIFLGDGQITMTGSNNVDSTSVVGVDLTAVSLSNTHGNYIVVDLDEAPNMTNKHVMVWDETDDKWYRIAKDSVGGSSPGGDFWSLDGNTVGSYGSYFGTNDEFDLRFFTDGVQRAVFDSTTGYLGIGPANNSPAAVIDVEINSGTDDFINLYHTGSTVTVFRVNSAGSIFSGSNTLWDAGNVIMGHGGRAHFNEIYTGPGSSTDLILNDNAITDPTAYVLVGASASAGAYKFQVTGSVYSTGGYATPYTSSFTSGSASFFNSWAGQQYGVLSTSAGYGWVFTDNGPSGAVMFLKYGDYPSTNSQGSRLELRAHAIFNADSADLDFTIRADTGPFMMFAHAGRNETYMYMDTASDAGDFKLQIGGAGYFTGDVTVPTEAYGVGWNGSNEVPTKDAIYDKIETISAGSPGGSNKQFQYNNSSAFAGSAMLTQETDQILITGTSTAGTTPFVVDGHEDLTGYIAELKQVSVKIFGFHQDGYIELNDVSAPGTPAAGVGRLFLNSDNLKVTDDNGATYTVTELQPKSISIQSPTASENVTLFYTTRAITVTEVRGVMLGASQSITLVVNYGSSRATADGTIVASNTFDSGDSGYQTTGFAFTLNTTSIPAGSYIWLTSSATSGTINELNVSLTYRQ